MESITRERASSMTVDEIKTELGERLRRVKQIRSDNGGTLVGLEGAAAEEVARLTSETTVLGEELDNRPVGLGLRDGSTIPMPFPNGGKSLKESAVLEAGQSFSEWVRANDDVGGIGRERLSFGKFIRGLTTGDWTGAPFERSAALQEGSIGGGGALVPAPLSSELIDLARAKARVIQSGARIVPMTSQTLAIARLAGDPGSAWKAENAAVVEGPDPTFERVTLTAKTLIALVRASREVVADAVNMEQVLRNAFAEALSRKLDKAALYGSGVDPEPRGVKNTSGVTTISMGTNGAALTNYDRLVDQAQTLWDANFDSPTAYIMAPRTKAQLAKLKDTTNQPMQAPEIIASIPKYETTQVPVNLTQGTATNASDLFGGVWSEMLIGVRTRLEIEVLRERYAGDNFQVGFLAHLRADIQLAHPAAFVVTVGIIP